MTVKVTESNVSQVVKSLRDTFHSGVTLPYKFRLEQLKNIKRMFDENKQLLIQAVQKDLGKKHVQEIVSSEINLPLVELDHTIGELSYWMEPEKVSTGISAQPASSYIYSEPKGVVLIISPWNYPINLAIVPLIGAIAAGNTVLLKVSRHSRATGEILEQLLTKYLDNQCFVVESEGGASMITKLIEEKWDHIFFTGSCSVGKIVYQAAAKHLTPVTLELGGKNPCIVDKDVDLDLAAKRIAWGKFFNNGQTCIGVDHLIVHKDIENELIEKLIKVIKEFYGENAQESQSYSRIISKDHVKRIEKLFNDGEVVYGGKSDVDDRYIAPTIIKNPKPDSILMSDEIFGPVLPIIAVNDTRDAINILRDKPLPLALYFFGRDTKMQEEVLARTRSGAALVNDVILHFTNSNLPFGGVGESGLGSYHGKLTFDTFVHKKPVIKSTTRRILDLPLRYPPYTDNVSWVVDKVTRTGW